MFRKRSWSSSDPNAHLAGDTHVSNDDDANDLRELYVATYPRLVRVTGAITRDLGEAEDAVQEAFARLMTQWPKVSRYEDPEAWVRKVALGLARNRRRKFRNGLRAALRRGPAAEVPEPSGDAIDISRALATLSRPHREVIVLHHLGLDVAAIADELAIPVGTAKSRLARARAALAPLLREDLTHRA